MPEVGSLTFLEGAGEGRTDDWSEVVTRYPYGNVGMDHLLSKEYKIPKYLDLKKFVLLGFERSFSQNSSLKTR